MTKRKMITVIIDDDVEHLVCGSFDDVIRNITNAKASYEFTEFNNIRLNLETICVPYCDDRKNMILKGDRLETDNEFNKRIKNENDQKERQRQYDLVQLKALQEKYKDVLSPLNIVTLSNT